MKVSVFGPNLSGPAQKKGQFHVHAVGCGDCKHYGRRGSKYGGDGPWEMEASSRKDIVENIYGDFEDYDPANWQDYDELFVAPCAKLA